MGPEIPYNLRMPSRERRTIFREMAKGELRRGPLTPRRHRALVAYAARLGIHPAESIELIAEASSDLGLFRPAAATPAPAGANSASGRVWVMVSILLVAATALHVLVRMTW